jgi:hypothetical protein
LTQVILTPASTSLATGGTRQFSVSGQWSNGATTAPSVNYTATGGTVTTAGLYTAGSTAGTFQVIATQQGGTLADSAVATVTPPPTLTQVILTPATTSLATGGTQQFSVSGQWSNGATTAPSVTYTATGGTVTSGGLYTAGSTAGTFRVIATQQGGTLADSAVVTVTPAPPLGNIPELPGGYVLRGRHLGSPLVPAGWLTNSDGTRNIDVVSDAGAPASPTDVMRAIYAAGFTDGVAPMGLEFPGTSGRSAIFATWWFKYSPQFQGHSSRVNKQMFLFGSNGTVIFYVACYFSGSATQGIMDVQFEGGATGTHSFKRVIQDLGAGTELLIDKATWHRVSVEIVYGANGTGKVRLWVDGTKVADLPNAILGTTLDVMKIDPTWGGNVGERMAQTGYLYYDDVQFYTN